VFSTRKVASSNPALLGGTASSSALPGQYPFVPARMAQSHHVLSSGMAARDQALGGGTFSFRFGGHVNAGVSLADLNGGAGVASGKIRIIDRNGVRGDVDLRYARTVDDVLQAINATDEIDVVAVADGDRIRLHRPIGRQRQPAGARSFWRNHRSRSGLANINVAADEAVGATTSCGCSRALAWTSFATAAA
jgi:flagellar hook-associated protein 2